jgi:hypothetical protein
MKKKITIIRGKVKSWGLRLPVPAPILKGIGVGIGDEIVWSLGERNGKKVAILGKADKEDDEI